VYLSATAAKRLRLLHLGSDEWYIDEIKAEYTDSKKKGYERVEIGEYICKILRGYAEADFEFLGQKLPGVPDKIEPGTQGDIGTGFIPTRLQYQPYWLELNPRVASYSTFRLYHWLKNCQHWDTRVHINSTYWLHIIETQVLEEESYLALAPFRKPAEDPILSAEAQADLDYLLAQDEEASSVRDIELKFHQVEDLNHHIADDRPIPTYQGGVKLEIPVLQWYLSNKIEEWVALGGERAFEKGEFLVGIHKHQRS
jgi:hypothetical protein